MFLIVSAIFECQIIEHSLSILQVLIEKGEKISRKEAKKMETATVFVVT